MSLSYDRLWKLLIDKQMKKTALLEGASISTSVLAKMGRNEAVSLKNIDKICQFLNCKIEDVVEFKK